ncbi:MAG: hypothetical protein EBU84_00725 [Actinobacteria bacterium]|nr:hypothetical protein [Actinomycetota bacterium]
MSQVFDADTGAAEPLAADPAPTRTEIDLAPCTFGGDTFRNPCFWILVGVAGCLAVQYLFAKRKE